MREAVPVDKARGQAVFEDITRGQVDPGLLQVTQGNNFKLRVYPIPAQGTRQVLIRYAETLTQARGPPRLSPAARIRGHARQFPARPQRRGRRRRAGQVARPARRTEFQARRRRLSRRRCRATATPAAACSSSIFRLPPGAQAYTQAFDAKTYFYAEVPVPAREAPRALPRTRRPGVGQLGLGRRARSRARVRAARRVTFAACGNGEVRLTRIRDTAEAAQTFSVVDGDWRALRAALEATAYDGATNLGAFVPDSTVEEYLLFSDGLANFGARPFAAPRRAALQRVRGEAQRSAAAHAHRRRQRRPLHRPHRRLRARRPRASCCSRPRA